MLEFRDLYRKGQWHSLYLHTFLQSSSAARCLQIFQPAWSPTKQKIFSLYLKFTLEKYHFRLKFTFLSPWKSLAFQRSSKIHLLLQVLAIFIKINIKKILEITKTKHITYFIQFIYKHKFESDAALLVLDLLGSPRIMGLSGCTE